MCSNDSLIPDVKELEVKLFLFFKVELLTELSDSGHTLSAVDETFLENKQSGQYLENMEHVNDDA